MYGMNLMKFLTSYFPKKKLKKERHVLCTCREPEKRALILDLSGKLDFEGECYPERTYFKISFDSKQWITRKLNKFIEQEKYAIIEETETGEELHLKIRIK